jgi:hypothetical protein
MATAVVWYLIHSMLDAMRRELTGTHSMRIDTLARGNPWAPGHRLLRTRFVNQSADFALY